MIKAVLSNAVRKLTRLKPASSERVAVIIPVYNMTEFLEAAIRSAANQHYPHKEIIVVDDGSEEKAAAEIRRICNGFDNITLLCQEHAGAAVARDRGVVHTSSEFIHFLDADDILLPGALEQLVGGLRCHQDAVAAYGKVAYIDKDGTILGERFLPEVPPAQVLHDLLERRFCFCNGAICIRKKALEKLKSENHHLRYAEDWVLWCHLALAGDIVYAGGQIMLHYRLYKRNVGAFIDSAPEMFVAYDTVFTHPAFINAVGQHRLDDLRKKCICRLHMRLAYACILLSQAEKARYHMEKVDCIIPLEA